MSALQGRPLRLRLRLTLIFVLAMAIVFATIGAFLYFETKSNLDAGIDAALRLRARSIAASLSSGSKPGELEKQDPLFELIDSRGVPLAASPSARGVLKLTADERRRALKGSYAAYRGEQTRLLAERIAPSRVVVVGSPLRQREHALEGLATALAAGGPLALLLAALAAYWLAGRAFASIEAMRARAAEISRASPVGRLPLDAAPEEIRLLGETLNGMLERMATSAEHERRFVADASHELRTPLALLQTELEVAQRDAADEDELRAAIASALEETERLSRVVGSLLTLAHADEHQLVKHITVFPLEPLLDRLVLQFATRAKTEQRELHADAAGLYVRADPVRLEQALANLLENAFVHGEGRVSIRAEDAGEIVRIRVRDEGRGFSSAFASRAFDRFSRAPGRRRTSGSGLGLSIVAAVAAAHGGEAQIARTATGAEVWISVAAARPN